MFCIYFDEKRRAIPWFIFCATSLKKYTRPLWSSFNLYHVMPELYRLRPFFSNKLQMKVCIRCVQYDEEHLPWQENVVWCIRLYI